MPAEQALVNSPSMGDHGVSATVDHHFVGVSKFHGVVALRLMKVAKQ